MVTVTRRVALASPRFLGGPTLARPAIHAAGNITP